MKVSELIEELNKMPQDLQVNVVYDGGPRGVVEHVWKARGSDDVLLSADMEYVYNDYCRPDNAPTELENPYWTIGES